ncbi:hypothetical protein F53441_2220 [Fusarium austroafricanum]|uniref:Pre-mRNA splicing factor CLF1 n=1 Tax=Fusarium austroafricanum TaxID=2364996 RepID=A0A8H4P466_9HYPO|nr:hypothetical protein F53441_2220 [Fusarium austroafricanum]
MSLPEPPSSLDNGCSVVHDNTLYVFTPTAFMSLPLKEGSEWKKLKMGQQVTGGVCVITDTALFIVGGSGGQADYNGLQKYIFADKKWETLAVGNTALRNLQYHGAAYIKNTDQIVVAAGSQDGRETPSGNTYYFPASGPYTPQAAGPASESVNPILLPWSDTEVCLLGGSDWNKQVSLFNAATSWRAESISLVTPVTRSSKAMVISGDDGSKTLYVFNLEASPNQVHRYVVWGSNNQPGTDAADQNAKRDLSLNNWPDYNATLAPKASRSGYSIAQDSNGRVVFVGGNKEEPLAFFDMKENSWLNASDIVGDESQKLLSAETSTGTKTKTHSTKTSSTESSTKTKSVTTDFTSTTSATATDDSFSSATISESSSATNSNVAAVGGASSDGNSGLSSNAILGITLGTILGFIALLIVILLLLRRRKKTQQPSPENTQPRHDFPPDEKDPMGLGGGPVSPFRGHHSNMSQESFSSMAILMGRAGKNKPSISRKLSNGSNRTSGSTEHKQLKSSIGKPVLQEMQHPVLQGQDTRGVAFDPTVAEPRPRNGPLETQDGLRRSSGWNRYWSGGSALQILGFGSSKRNTVGSDSDSHYSDSIAHRNPRVTQDSATVPPLNFDFRPEMNRVNSGSPVVAEYNKNIPFRDGVAGKIERPISKASSGYSSGIPESVNETWDPDHKDKPWGTDRATSSIYNPSFYFGAPLSPRVPPPSQTPPSGVSTQPQLAMASQSSDMSWLNLGDRSRQ